MGGKSAIHSIGERFGRLVVTGVDFPDATASGQGHARVTATCDCGAIWTGKITGLRSGATKSCGCLSIDKATERVQTHGMSRTKEHNTWKALLNRCRNPNSNDYRLYGGRGVKVCERWLLFENFYADMGDAPSPQHSVDRINSDGDYEPSNCKWSTPKEQARNTSRVNKVEYKGVVKPVSEWCEELGLNYHTTRTRIAKGIPIVEAFEKPAAKLKTGQMFDFNGLSMTLAEWARYLGVGATTLHYRLTNGFPYEAVFVNTKLK